MENEWDLFDEIFDMSGAECKNHLDEIRTIYRFTLELTLNFPRNARFKRLVRKSQEWIYHDLLYYIKLQNSFIKETKEYIEDCKDGLPHMHAILYCEVDKPYSAEGVVMNVVNDWISQMPKQSRKNFYKFNYSYHYAVFKHPSILVQYNTDVERTKNWEQYISKNIPL